MSNEVRTAAPDLKGFLTKHMDAIKSVAASTLTPDRMVRLVCAAASRDEQLSKCTPLSILRSLSQAASMGLEPFDGRNEVHLVPRWNKKGNGGKGCLEATCLVGYPGLIRLATDTGKVRNIEARVVYSKDVFEVEYGIEPRIIHKPTFDKDHGHIVAFYAVAFLPDGSTTFEVMPNHEVEDIRDRSKDSDKFSPWKSDFSEMGRKTVVRRLCKYLPKSTPLAKALEIQAKAEAGEYMEGELVRPGDANPPEIATREVNEDGELEYVWTEDERNHCLCSLDGYIEAMVMGGVSESEAIQLADEYKAKIGTPDLSPAKWSDHLQSGADYRINKAKKSA
jgi:recombination protein RecT